MPVTILLKAIGMSNEEILATFHDFETFEIAGADLRYELVAERLRGDVARFDVADANGNVIVGKDKRINAKHVRDISAAGISSVVVPDDFVLGRVLAQDIADPETGEVLARANDEITEDLLTKLATAGVKAFKTLYINELDRGGYISQTLRSDETLDQWQARVAIYRMMRPGEPPTEDAVEALFQGLFYSEDRYDLSTVGRMKFNRRAYPEKMDDKSPDWLKRFYAKVGPTGEEGKGVLCNDDILAVIGVLVELRNGRGPKLTILITWVTGACVLWVNWLRTSSARVSYVLNARSRSVWVKRRATT